MSVSSRSQQIADLNKTAFDVLVIGGGIVGSGVARDAAMRGLRVALVDRHDFAFGTSSRSSRLLHGGLRYLEQGDLRLVREASVEKKIIQQIAPHLTQPLAFIFPSYRPQGRPLWQLRVGVQLYDLLCSGRNFLPSRGLSAAETLAAVPGLNPANLRGAVRYGDALTNDARLTIDTLRSAARHGATLANYVKFSDAQRNGTAWSCQLHDVRTGLALTTRTRTLVNATGPWAQTIPHSAVKLRLSKGIHVVVDRARLPIGDAVVLTEGKRILFVLPWGERVIVGTTDTDYADAPENVRVLPDDIAYVLRIVNSAFPRAALAPTDIVSSWAGLRPLVAENDDSPSDVSRAHEIRQTQPGWWDVTGGKLTTYRLMAEQVVDQLARHLDHVAPRSRTASEPLLPPDEISSYSAITPPAVSRAAVEHYVTREWAQSVDDVMTRRSGWHYTTRDTAPIATQVAAWMAEIAGWSAEDKKISLVAYRDRARAME